MTFQQYIENLHVWNTRNPQADINVTADYSDDYNDAAHFLLPFMRKVKSFYWYCRVAIDEMAEHNTPRPRRTTWGERFSKNVERTFSLHNMVGTPTQGSAHLDDLRFELEKVRDELKEFYDGLEVLVGHNIPLDSARARQQHRDGMKTILSNNYIERNIIQRMRDFLNTPVRLYAEEEELRRVVERIRTRIERMVGFFEASKDQFKRVLSFSISDRSPIGLRGRG